VAAAGRLGGLGKAAVLSTERDGDEKAAASPPPRRGAAPSG